MGAGWAVLWGGTTPGAPPTCLLADSEASTREVLEYAVVYRSIGHCQGGRTLCEGLMGCRALHVPQGEQTPVFLRQGRVWVDQLFPEVCDNTIVHFN